jgi:trehalose 6-phosphate phosphatase
MTQSLFDHFPEISAAVDAARHVLLFLDFDGTLAPIFEDPSEASMPPETRKALSSLAGRRKFSLAVISGRALADLRQRVGLPNLIYAGNHGLEIDGPGLHFVEPDAARCIHALGELARYVRGRLHGIPGVAVENKVLTASVHFRRAPVNRLREVEQIVYSAAESTGSLFQVTKGLEVFEIRPRVNWHKGMAVGWIRETLGMHDALPIFVGDDLTDEDAFTALPDGITVSVGSAKVTSARFHLEQQEEVQEFLLWLSELEVDFPAATRCRA